MRTIFMNIPITLFFTLDSSISAFIASFHWTYQVIAQGLYIMIFCALPPTL